LKAIDYVSFKAIVEASFKADDYAGFKAIVETKF